MTTPNSTSKQLKCKKRNLRQSLRLPDIQYTQVTSQRKERTITIKMKKTQMSKWKTSKKNLKKKALRRCSQTISIEGSSTLAMQTKPVTTKI